MQFKCSFLEIHIFEGIAMDWAAHEMRGIDLGDKRLNNRAVKILYDLAEKPAESIPCACGSWKETKATYRFHLVKKKPKLTKKSV
jgi:hypothetical protein